MILTETWRSRNKERLAQRQMVHLMPVCLKRALLDNTASGSSIHRNARTRKVWHTVQEHLLWELHSLHSPTSLPHGDPWMMAVRCHIVKGRHTLSASIRTGCRAAGLSHRIIGQTWIVTFRGRQSRRLGQIPVLKGLAVRRRSAKGCKSRRVIRPWVRL
jgi:hypothetical protein